MPKLVSEPAWRKMLHALHDAYGSRHFTAKEVVDSEHDAVTEAMASMCSWQAHTAGRVGSFFRNNQGVVMDGLRLVKGSHPDRTKTAYLWFVEILDNPPRVTTMPLNESDRP